MPYTESLLRSAGPAIGILIIACIGPAPHKSFAAAADAGGPIVRIEQVRALSADALSRAPAVNLRGVVTFHEPESGLTFLQDGGAGIAISAGVPSRLPGGVAPGVLIEVSGVARPGKFAPVITGPSGEPPRVSLLGGAPMPKPLLLGAEELARGYHDGCWIELSGIVLYLEVKAFDPGWEDLADEFDVGASPSSAMRIRIELGTVAGRFTLIVPWRAGGAPPADMVESRVRVRAVLGSITNPRSQWMGVLLFSPSLDHVIVERPPLGDPFALPLIRANEVLRFRSQRPEEERVRVQGVVTLQQPRYRFFMTSDEGPLEVQTNLPQTGLRPGARVDVVGHPVLLGSRVVLQDALFRPISDGPPPAPRATTRTGAQSAFLDSEFIRIAGRLSQSTLRAKSRILLVEADDGLIEVSFAQTMGPDDLRRLQQLQLGSELELTGVALIQSAAEWGGGVRPYSLNLLVHGMDDIVVTRRPPWWTVGRLLALVGFLACLAVMGFVWVYLLQRRVEQQTGTIRRNLEREALWEERSRIARDIHDDVGAALTQISLLGELGRRDGLAVDETRRQLERIALRAREAVRSLDEIVWTVNPRNDTVTRASSYFCQTVQDMLAGTGIRCRLHVPDDLPELGLGARARHHLFLAMKESVTNIIKHAGASEVHLILAVRGESFALRLEDDGRGFDPAEKKPLRSGLGNLRKRLAEVGGRCDISSRPGAGTAVTLEVPTTAAPTSNAG